jgi:hypothetical protein
MDLKIYYDKIRQTAARIADDYPVVVSRETGDGGREGVLTEVPKHLAARMVVDGQARLASEEEALSFRWAQAEAKRRADEAAEASRLQFTLVPKEPPRSERG